MASGCALECAHIWGHYDCFRCAAIVGGCAYKNMCAYSVKYGGVHGVKYSEHFGVNFMQIGPYLTELWRKNCIDFERS